MHSLLHLSGTVTKWIEAGLTHIFIFQDTNFFAPRSGLVGLGVCASHDFDMCSLCVPRIAGEAIGGICTLTGEGKTTMTVNVEYNQIDAMLKATEEYKDGDVNDPSTVLSGLFELVVGCFLACAVSNLRFASGLHRTTLTVSLTSKLSSFLAVALFLLSHSAAKLVQQPCQKRWKSSRRS